jgi:membrane fusion protein (multidrug efflux system)
MLKRAVLVPIVVLAIAVILLFSARRFWVTADAGLAIQRTDDAYVDADSTPLSTRISGTVRRVDAGDYQSVKRGQLLVELDDEDYQASLAEANAEVDAARAEYSANEAAIAGADAGITSAQAGIDQAQSAADSSQATVAANEATLAQAESEFKRQETLLVGKAATRQQFEQAQTSRLNALAALQGHRADLSRAEAMTAGARAALNEAKQRRIALNASTLRLRAQIDARLAAVTVAKVNLSYAKIFAPADGALGEFRVHPGQLVGAGIQIVPLVQSGYWIEANFRETQLEHVRPGDTVDIHIDALSAHAFHGHVLEIAPASGSQFALLPPDNATGNYTKVVQRIPVRIALDQTTEVSQLRPGFSAEVAIHVSGSQSGDEPSFPTGARTR